MWSRVLCIVPVPTYDDLIYIQEPLQHYDIEIGSH